MQLNPSLLKTLSLMTAFEPHLSYKKLEFTLIKYNSLIFNRRDFIAMFVAQESDNFPTFLPCSCHATLDHTRQTKELRINDMMEVMKLKIE